MGRLEGSTSYLCSSGQEQQGWLCGTCLLSWGWSVQQISPNGYPTLSSMNTPHGLTYSPALSRQDRPLPTFPITLGRFPSKMERDECPLVMPWHLPAAQGGH